MNYFLSSLNWIWSNIALLNQNQAQVVNTLIGASVTLIVALIGIRVAFRQIKKQFEQRIIYEGWKDLQEKLFALQNAHISYDTGIQLLNYFVNSQHNPLVNGNNIDRYRQNKWNEIEGLFQNVMKAYVSFLRSFENHEFIFLKLKKMEKEFQKEYSKRVTEGHMPFMEKLFPEMYGEQNNLSLIEAKNKINSYWEQLAEISAFLDDFRIELQNETVGKILNKKVSKRVPKGDYNILTTKGFIRVKKILSKGYNNL
jgi:hypothetical protein